MKTYTVKSKHGDYSIYGETIVEAVEKKFNKIMKTSNIGNAGGYYLHSVSMKYNPGIIGSKGGAELIIKSQGSDIVSNYDEKNDPIKVKTVWIGGVKPEEIPEPYEFELKPERKDFDPFDDDYTKDDISSKYGVMWALIDTLAMNYSVRPPQCEPYIQVSSRVSGLPSANPMRFTERMFLELNRLKIKDHPEANKIRVRIDQLLAKVEGVNSINGNHLLAQAKTRIYFYTINQKQTLTALRKDLEKSQVEIAEAIGVSPRQYQHIEYGEKQMKDVSVDIVTKMADLFGISRDELLEKCEPKFKHF